MNLANKPTRVIVAMERGVVKTAPKTEGGKTMKQTNASPKHSSRIYYLGTLAMLASMLLLPHLIPS